MPRPRIEDLIGYEAQYPSARTPTHWAAGHLRFVGEEPVILPPDEFSEEAERRLAKRSTHHAPAAADAGGAAATGWYTRIDNLHFFTPFWVRFKAKLVFNVCAWLLCLIQIGLTIGLAVTDNYGLGAYTLWSFTMLTIFACCLAVAVIVEQLTLTLVTLWMLPIVLGNVVTVAIAIIIILQNNIQLFLDDTKCDVPPPLHPTSMALKHTGDWLLHGWPVFGMLLLLIAGMDYFGRLVIVHSLALMGSIKQWIYFIYWFVAPLVPLIIYDIAFDVDKKYPTSFTWIERALILIAIMWVWMLFMWVVLTARTGYGQIMYAFMATHADRKRNPYSLHSQQSFSPEELQLQQRIDEDLTTF